MKIRRATSFLVVAALLVPRPVAAENEKTPPPLFDVGDRLRVVEHGRFDNPVIGEVAAFDDEALTLRRAPGVLRRLPWKSIDRVQISRGTYADPKRGARTGALVLGIPMALLAGCVGCFDPDFQPSVGSCGSTFCLETAAVGFLVGAAVGAVIGGSLGSIKSERWVEHALPPPAWSLGVMPYRDGAAARLTLRF